MPAHEVASRGLEQDVSYLTVSLTNKENNNAEAGCVEIGTVARTDPGVGGGKDAGVPGDIAPRAGSHQGAREGSQDSE